MKHYFIRLLSFVTIIFMLGSCGTEPKEDAFANDAKSEQYDDDDVAKIPRPGGDGEVLVPDIAPVIPIAPTDLYAKPFLALPGGGGGGTVSALEMKKKIMKIMSTTSSTIYNCSSTMPLDCLLQEQNFGSL